MELAIIAVDNESGESLFAITRETVEIGGGIPVVLDAAVYSEKYDDVKDNAPPGGPRLILDLIKELLDLRNAYEEKIQAQIAEDEKSNGTPI